MSVFVSLVCQITSFLYDTLISSTKPKTLIGELAKHAVSEGTKATTKFQSSNHCSSSSKRQTLSARAGLVFPVSKIMNLMKTKLPRVAQIGAVYLAGVMEYLVFFFFFFCLSSSFLVVIFFFFLIGG